MTRRSVVQIDLDRLLDPAIATMAAPRWIARRVQALDEEIALGDARPRLTGGHAAPAHLSERLRREAAPGHLIRISRLPASFGRHDLHPLDRGGGWAANSAIHHIVHCRMRHADRTAPPSNAAPPRG